MPPALVRPYVRVIPIAYIPPAPPRRSTVPVRIEPPLYRARHKVRPVPSPQRRRRHTRRRRGPALAWGALLIGLAATAITLRSGEEPGLAQAAPVAESAQLQTAVVPAPVLEPVVSLLPAPVRPDAPVRKGRA